MVQPSDSNNSYNLIFNYTLLGIRYNFTDEEVAILSGCQLENIKEQRKRIILISQKIPNTDELLPHEEQEFCKIYFEQIKYRNRVETLASRFPHIPLIKILDKCNELLYHRPRIQSEIKEKLIFQLDAWCQSENRIDFHKHFSIVFHSQKKFWDWKELYVLYKVMQEEGEALDKLQKTSDLLKIRTIGSCTKAWERHGQKLAEQYGPFMCIPRPCKFNLLTQACVEAIEDDVEGIQRQV